MTIFNVNPKLQSLSSTILTKRVKLTLLACLPLISLQGMAIEEDHYDVEANRKATMEMAVSNDINILAKELGLKPYEVEDSMAFQDKFEEFFKEIMKKYPNKISRVWLAPDQQQKAHIQFVGRLPDIKTDLDVDMFGGGTYSFQEQDSRADYLSKLLRSKKQSNFMTYFDHKDGKIKLEMKVAKASRALTRNSLESLLSNKRSTLDSDENAAFNNFAIDEINLEVIVGEGEIYDLEYARGGEWLRDDGRRECTSGWAVSGPRGDGIVTAAHCSGLNQLEHSYSPVTVNMIWRSQERGNGDAEYHTTSHTEVAEYYATNTQVRDVTGIKPTWSMFNNSRVCEYGRSSGTRTCNHYVISNNVTANFTDGATVSNLVRVTGDNSIGGDSGGPWSWGTIAWGVHSGSNGSTSLFTPVQRVQSELNVRIKTQ